jgi:phospholipase/carboxylesterase
VELVAGRVTARQDRRVLLAHRLVVPRAPSDRPPLLLLLHGIGADENDLLPLAMRLDPRFLVVSARAPDEAEPMGYRWYALDWSVAPPRADPAEIAARRDLLARFVEEATAGHGADPARVFVLGFSQGAVMALALLLARPDLVRGVVAHSGRLVRLPGPPPSPEALARAEVLVLHGADDEVIPALEAGKIHAALAPLLGPRLSTQVHDGLGHGVSEESLAAAASWLTARLDRPG